MPLELASIFAFFGLLYSTYFGGTRGLPGDAFVAVLAPDGGLSNAIYLGGSGYDHGTDITLDSGGNIYVTGYTASTDFPTTLGAFQTAYGGGEFDAFVVKLDPAAATPIYSTYLGGNTDDRGGGITVHTATRNVFITGCTNSRNFPNRLGFTDRPGGGFDAFVTWLNAAGNDVIFSTWYGGSGDDCGWAIAVDPFGQAWITGATRSRDLPFAAGVFGSGVDAFVAKFQPFDGSLGYATYLGGRGDDLGHAIAVDALFNVYVAGETSSANFPTTPDAVQSRYAGGGCLVLFPDIYGVIGCGDGFLTVFRTRDIGSEAVAFSTYLGGSLVDYFNGVGLDAVGNVYLSGNTGSSDFPATPGVQQPSFAGGGDTVLVKLSPPQFTTAQAPSFRYAAKIICGKSPGRLHAAGAYFTVVNVHNPTDRQIALTKRLAFVDVAEKAGPVSESAKAMLGPDQALAVDCPDLRQLSGGTQEFLEGYLLIDNLTQLDVVATYSAAGENGLVTTLDVQSIAPTAVAHPAGTAH